MKNTIKKTIIIIAIIAAIVPVLYFAISDWSSATEFTSDNQHYNETIRTINKFSEIEASVPKSDSLYQIIYHKIDFLVKNKSLNERERDAALETFMGKYVPIFISQSFKRFDNSTWYEKDHTYMKKRIQELKSFKGRKGIIIEDGSHPDSEMKLIQSTIDKYNEAKALSRRKDYMGIADTKSKINRAKTLAQDTYLNKCTAIKNSLNGLSEEIHESHISKIKIAVNQMYEYQAIEQAEFDSIAENAADMIKEYKNNAGTLYGYSKKIDDLEATRYAQYNNALRYYSSINHPQETNNTTQNIYVSQPTNTEDIAPANPNQPKVRSGAPILLKPDPKSRTIGYADNSKIHFLNKHNDKYYRVLQGTLIGYLSTDNTVK